MENGQCNLQDPNGDLGIACRCGCLENVNKAIVRGARHWNRGLYEACVAGQVSMAKLMFSHGANDIVLEGIRRTCERGHLLVMQLLVQVFKMMKKNKTEEYKNALNVAVKYRRTALVQFLVIITNTVHIGMRYACLTGDELYLDRLLLSSKIKDSTMTVDQRRTIPYGMCRAAIEGGHLYMIKRIMRMPNIFDKSELLPLVDEKGHILQARSLLYDAYKNPNLDIVRFLESHCAELPEDRLRLACQGGHMAIIKHVVSSMKIVEPPEWEPACTVACRWGQLQAAKYIATHATNIGVNIEEWDWEDILEDCFVTSNVETVKWVLSQSQGLSLSFDSFQRVCNNNRHHYVHYFVEQHITLVDYDILLSFACRNNDLDLARHALRHTSTVGDDSDVKTPMNYACDHMNVNMVKLLISHDSPEYIGKTSKYFIIALYANGIARKHFGADAERTLDSWQEKIKFECTLHMPILPVLLDMIYAFC